MLQRVPEKLFEDAHKMEFRFPALSPAIGKVELVSVLDWVLRRVREKPELVFDAGRNGEDTARNGFPERNAEEQMPGRLVGARSQPGRRWMRSI
ncbi:MAG: hypothetical protein ACLTW9_03780 [Enterocloster sp.]